MIANEEILKAMAGQVEDLRNMRAELQWGEVGDFMEGLSATGKLLMGRFHMGLCADHGGVMTHDQMRRLEIDEPWMELVELMKLLEQFSAACVEVAKAEQSDETPACAEFLAGWDAAQSAHDEIEKLTEGGEG